MTQIVNLTNLTTQNALQPIGTKRGFSPISTFSRGGGTQQASITFNDPDSGKPAIKVWVKSSYLQGRKSNFLKFGLYLQAGVRYFCTLFEDDNDKLDGTVSTAGHSLGATTGGAIVDKINTSALSEFVQAVLINDYTNKDYTGAGGVDASDAIPMSGGRG
jgi:hypothetical protein